jgi:hypothetical protein
VRVSGTCRIAIMYLEGPGFMQRDEFPANIIFGNSVIQIPRRQTIITTQSDFEDETAWERTVLILAVPLMPLTASGDVLDLRTGSIATTLSSLALSSMVGSAAVEELLNSLLPVLFGAAWKIMDLGLELAFALAGLAPQHGRRWKINEKSQHAVAHSGNLPDLTNTTNIWQALGLLYSKTVEVRHALVPPKGTGRSLHTGFDRFRRQRSCTPSC